MSDRVCPLCHWIGDRKDCNCTFRESLLIRAIACLLEGDLPEARAAIALARGQFKSATGRDPVVKP